MLQLLLLAFAFSVCNANTIQFMDCGSTGGTVNSIAADWCKTTPCTVAPGGTYPLHINFTTSRELVSSQNSVNAVVFGLNFPLQLQNPDGCATINCPVPSGRTIVFDYSLTCPSFAPQMTLTLKWQAKDKAGNDVLCINAPVRVQN